MSRTFIFYSIRDHLKDKGHIYRQLGDVIGVLDGTMLREGEGLEGFAQRLLDVLQDQGGIAPAWQVQTEQVKWQQATNMFNSLMAANNCDQLTDVGKFRGAA